MNYKTITKVFFTILFVIFIALMFANKTGYYKTKSYNNVVLTNEQIMEFEKDILEGKEIDVKKYTKDMDVDYTNGLSNALYTISLKLERVVDKTIQYIFKGANNLVAD